MKGLIVVSRTIYTYRERYLHLFNLIKNNLGFRIVEVDNDLDGSKIKEDVILLFKGIWKHRPQGMKSIIKLARSQKLIGYFMDIHGGWNTEVDIKRTSVFHENFLRILVRCNKILCPHDYAFRIRWTEFAGKYENFPQFAAPFHFLTKMAFKKAPIMKCLITGAMEKNYYPIRTHIAQTKNKNTVCLPHPGYISDEEIKRNPSLKIGTDYLQEINKYYCSLATSSVLDYTVSKYFEIPASGALLLALYSRDLDKLGFVNGKNYIKIEKENFFKVLQQILENPDKYEHIRNEGRSFVLKNHTEINRFEQFKKVLGEL